MKILGIERDNTACNHYRVLQPLYKLRQHGLADCLTIGDHRLHTQEAADKVMEADIVVFQRPADENWLNFIKLCQKHGKTIVLDYDDDPFNTSPLNPYYKFVGTREYGYKWPSGQMDMIWQDGENGFDIERNITRNDMFRTCFRKADMVTTTTGILRDTFLKLNSNVKVLPNVIDFGLYKKYPMIKSDKEVRIGYQCGASHYEDLYLVKNAIKRVLEKNDNAKFVYLGDFRFKNLFQDIPRQRIEFHDWVTNVAYPYKMALCNFDIGICPLVDNEFNRNKSCIKFLDYATQDAVSVASNIPPYSPVIRNDETGYLVDSEDEWVDRLSMLCRDHKLRRKIGKAAHDFAYENYNSDKLAYKWRDAYESLIKKDLTEVNDGTNICAAAK